MKLEWKDAKIVGSICPGKAAECGPISFTVSVSLAGDRQNYLRIDGMQRTPIIITKRTDDPLGFYGLAEDMLEKHIAHCRAVVAAADEGAPKP